MLQNLHISDFTVSGIFDSKSSKTAFLRMYHYYFWPEVAGDVISGMAIEDVGMFAQNSVV